MRTVIRGAIAALAMGAAGFSANAADLPSYKSAPPAPIFVDNYQPFQVRLKVGGVVPLDGTARIYDNTGAVLPLVGLSAGPGSLVPYASTSISSAIIPMLDVAYYFNKNWAVEAICCISHHHIQGIGSLYGGDLGRTWVFPPSLLLQYHFTNFGAFQPYVGVGVNFTAYFGTRAGNNYWPFLTPAGVVGYNSFYSTTITPSWGVVGQIGADYMFNEHWGVNADVKYIMMEPNAHSWIANQGSGLGTLYVPVNGAVKINPLVISAGLTYRFGGGLVKPLF